MTDPLLLYFSPKHEKLKRDGVVLNKALILGDIGVGKTTTVEAIFRKVNQSYKGYDHLNLKTKDWPRLYRSHEEPSFKQKIRDYEGGVINIFIDDAAGTMSSKSYSVSKINSWYTIRHQFMGSFGLKRATVNIIIGIQRFMALANYVRENTALLIWKAYPAVDIRARQDIDRLTDDRANILRDWAMDINFHGDTGAMEKNLICGAGKPYVLDIPHPRGDPEDFWETLEDLVPTVETLNKRKKHTKKAPPEKCQYDECNRKANIMKWRLCRRHYDKLHNKGGKKALEEWAANKV